MADVVCIDCGLHYREHGLDIVLPRAQWLDLTPDTHDDSGVLCGICIARRAAALGGTVIHAVIEFSPPKRSSAT